MQNVSKTVPTLQSEVNLSSLGWTVSNGQIEAWTPRRAKAILNWVPHEFRFGCWEHCFYCGEPPQSQDHVIPWMFLSVVKDHDGSSWGIKTPCCSDCNTVLNRSFFPSLQRRCEELQNLLRKHLAKALRIPKWTEKEKRELGKNLQNHIRTRSNDRRRAIRRTTWQKTEEFQSLFQAAHESSMRMFPENKHLHAFMRPPWA